MTNSTISSIGVIVVEVEKAVVVVVLVLFILLGKGPQIKRSAKIRSLIIPPDAPPLSLTMVYDLLLQKFQ